MIREELLSKTTEEIIDIKGTEIVRLASKDTYTRESLQVEIVDINKIEGGVEVFVRAWKDGQQIGFGTDGTVDIERFLIYNPPILVPDPNGDILQEWEEEDIRTFKMISKSRRLREDPKEALLQVIEHNISVMKNVHGPKSIVAGKRGMTTSTFYPAAGANSPVDGRVVNDTQSSVWSTVRNSTTARLASSTDTAIGVISVLGTGGGPTIFGITRAFMGFNTASIPDTDTVTSATLTVTINTGGVGPNPGGNSSIYIVQSSQASASSLSTSDFDNVGSVSFGQSGVPDDSNEDNPYDITVNSTGLAAISKTGLTQWVLRAYHDFVNQQPTNTDETDGISFYAADQTGTSQDPKLVVEHSEPVTQFFSPSGGVGYSGGVTMY